MWAFFAQILCFIHMYIVGNNTWKVETHCYVYDELFIHSMFHRFCYWCRRDGFLWSFSLLWKWGWHRMLSKGPQSCQSHIWMKNASGWGMISLIQVVVVVIVVYNRFIWVHKIQFGKWYVYISSLGYRILSETSWSLHYYRK